MDDVIVKRCYKSCLQQQPVNDVIRVLFKTLFSNVLVMTSWRPLLQCHTITAVPHYKSSTSSSPLRPELARGAGIVYIYIYVYIYMRGFSITQQIAITYSIVAVVSNPPTLPPKTL